MEVAESAREGRRTRPSFAAGIFMGQVEPELVFPFPEQPAEDRAAADDILRSLEAMLIDELDPDAVDRSGAIPDAVMQRLHELGAFRLKLPKDAGGLGLSQLNYNRIVSLVASWCGSTAILLSGHQSIGVPTPLKLFGTEEQKQRYLPRLAQGEISAFALTEPETGSDPARMQTTATLTPEGDAWILDGDKLWCTNGPIADVLIVMARTPDKEIGGRARKQISAFIVESAWEGVSADHRCEFMGYGGIQSGRLTFEKVRVPRENLLWEEGQGLKLALITLNTGRLTLPATNTASAKQCLSIVRRWAKRREQWGAHIGAHEAVALHIGWIAAHTFAMEAVTDYAAALADRGDADIRIEAALAKLFASEAVFEVADRAVQVRGGRGYETAASLGARGEDPWPVERIFRESRLNRIVEGTSEIMRLFLAREALDPHLERAGALANPKAGKLAKVGAFLKATAMYIPWYLWRLRPSFGAPSDVPMRLRRHWARTKRGSHRLSRRILNQMARHGPSLEHRQGLLGRIVDEGVDLTACGLVIARAASRGDEASIALADLFCRYAQQRIRESRSSPLSLDRHATEVARSVLSGGHLAMETGVVELPGREGRGAAEA